ncbi:type II toxin-antitoxin system death-on-curing family toxin [Massilibacterium senegalense]|uniref:type II toxin-antitoxin system death-on-curing family toxin n=1 Tax=Massilibacterium senegalense TaxID=1632858 RepID=UPI002D770BBF|nr:type II toxin-antitoxin system death-on-curing family toxin [Massilibacterium senegalense]
MTPEVAILVNRQLIMEYSPDEFIGVKDHHLLASALTRPKQTIMGKDAYPSIFLKGAALMQSLAQNHCFYNANKRTALLCTALFFRYNGYRLQFENSEEEEDFVVGIVTHNYSLEEISSVLEEHVILIQ